jgi:hypothetical protein
LISSTGGVRGARPRGSPREDTDEYVPLHPTLRPASCYTGVGRGPCLPRRGDMALARGSLGARGAGGPITLVMGAGSGEPWAGGRGPGPGPWAGGLAVRSCRVQSCCISYASDFSHAKIRWSNSHDLDNGGGAMVYRGGLGSGVPRAFHVIPCDFLPVFLACFVSRVQG